MDDIGRISREDYFALVTKPRHRLRWLMPMLLFVCLGAGGYSGYLTGKNSKSITLEQAVEVLAQAPNEEWEQLQALGAAFRGASRAVEVFDEWASRPGDAGINGTVYLRNLGVACIRSMRRHFDESGPHRPLQEECLQDFKKALQ